MRGYGRDYRGYDEGYVEGWGMTGLNNSILYGPRGPARGYDRSLARDFRGGGLRSRPTAVRWAGPGEGTRLGRGLRPVSGGDLQRGYGDDFQRGYGGRLEGRSGGGYEAGYGSPRGGWWGAGPEETNRFRRTFAPRDRYDRR